MEENKVLKLRRILNISTEIFICILSKSHSYIGHWHSLFSLPLKLTGITIFTIIDALYTFS